MLPHFRVLSDSHQRSSRCPRTLRRNRIFIIVPLLAVSVLFLIVIVPGRTSAAGTTTSTDDNSTEEALTWVEFTPTFAAMRAALEIDLAWHASENPPDCTWIDLLALYSARNGGNYKNFRASALNELKEKIENGAPIHSLTKNEKLLTYYSKAYHAALDGMVGEYTRVTVTLDADGNACEKRESAYGLRVFSPIGAGYSYTDYDDFGASRSYGYKRSHLGHDLLGSIGTPIVAIESGVIEHLGWNPYGGWRIGIRSFDGKRYYYYAHLRRGHPYAADLYEGKTVHAGEVIGYLGMTGYSSKPDTNGINVPHLHLGLQLIFKPSQIEGWNQIWLDLYQLMRFWGQNTSRSSFCEARGERVAAVYYEYPEEPD